MLKNLFPHAYIKNVFCIDYEKLFSFGYKALIFDIDNTLVHHGDEASNEVKTLFYTLKTIGFKVIFVFSFCKIFPINSSEVFLCRYPRKFTP